MAETPIIDLADPIPLEGGWYHLEMMVRVPAGALVSSLSIIHAAGQAFATPPTETLDFAGVALRRQANG